MDFSPDLYILKERKRYIVHFLNKEKLSKSEVLEIFSQFGNVIQINENVKTGFSHGMYFVAYQSLKETINCVLGLRDHSLVHLLPERSKINVNDTTTKNDSKSQKSITKEESKKNKKGKNKYNKLDKGLKDDYESTKKEQVDREVPHYYKQNHDEDSNTGSTIDRPISNLPQLPMTSNTVSEDGYDDLNRSSSIDSFMHIRRLCQTKDIINKNEVPALISSNMYKYSISTESLDEISSNTYSITEPEIVLAEHVIVANVPKDYGIHYILHLFEIYDPIAISLMKTIHQTGLRYCHVYFKNLQDALGVEKKYDKFVLASNRLIVLRSHSLLEEVTMEY